MFCPSVSLDLCVGGMIGTLYPLMIICLVFRATIVHIRSDFRTRQSKNVIIETASADPLSAVERVGYPHVTFPPHITLPYSFVAWWPYSLVAV